MQKTQLNEFITDICNLKWNQFKKLSQGIFQFLYFIIKNLVQGKNLVEEYQKECDSVAKEINSVLDKMKLDLKPI